MKMHQIGILLLGLMAALLCKVAGDLPSFGTMALALIASTVFIVLLTFELRDGSTGSYGFTQPSQICFGIITAIMASTMIWGDGAVIWAIQTEQPQFFGLTAVDWAAIISLPLLMVAGLVSGTMGFVLKPYTRTTYSAG